MMLFKYFKRIKNSSRWMLEGERIIVFKTEWPSFKKLVKMKSFSELVPMVYFYYTINSNVTPHLYSVPRIDFIKTAKKIRKNEHN